ncbi:DMT family transporter [Acuticoccus mangrovi]|uniref:DMT family transporter n=1 Tax=Acuticoccus mangrovi TaxID=2796142 RepID=A0A934IP29_9HYPH|nr:DMT family transporter [Acuticoccus mangrovi]MBJ3775455.1 DMT family transporter [Acuticoccus mangrovi]
MIIVYMLAAVLVGGLLSIQPAMNVMLVRAIQSPFGASAISVFVAFLTALLFALLMGRGEMTRTTLTAVPWWVYLAGTVGAIFVAGGVVIAPVTGALLFFVCVVAGQLLGAMLADHIGAFGLEIRTISPMRILGLALVLGGALLVQRG